MAELLTWTEIETSNSFTPKLVQLRLHSPGFHPESKKRLPQWSNCPPALRYGKVDKSVAGKTFDAGRFENRRGTQLAPVRLSNLKTPAPQKTGSGTSFMPKGTSIYKNIRRVKEEPEYEEGNFSDERKRSVSSYDDLNESLNSEDGSKYSYEETDDEEKDSHKLDHYDYMNASPLSPMHSADESPDALEINSLIQMNAKLSPNLDVPKTFLPQQTSNNSPSLSLRKVVQPAALKPLLQVKKKPKTSKGMVRNVLGKTSDNFNQNERYTESKMATSNEEQKKASGMNHKEWKSMQDELEKAEQEKYQKLIEASSKKLEEEELRLRKENDAALESLKSELRKRIEEEQCSGEKELEAIKIKYQGEKAEEEKKIKAELENLSKSLKLELDALNEANIKTKEATKKQLEEGMHKEIEDLEKDHCAKIKYVKETQDAELSSIEKTHKEHMDQIRETYANKENEARKKVEIMDAAENVDAQAELDRLKDLIKDKENEHQALLKELESVRNNISSEKDSLKNVQDQIANAQNSYSEIQDDIDKTETDLDLLRTEKSALISELSVLKDNINNEKNKLLDLKNAEMSEKGEEASIDHCDKGTNTISVSFNTLSSQTFVDVRDSSCQVQKAADDVACQTIELMQTMLNKTCQVELVPSKSINPQENALGAVNLSYSDTFVNKGFENILNDFGARMDTRMKTIEEQIKNLQENFVSARIKPSDANYVTQADSSPTEVKAFSITHDANLPTNAAHFNATNQNTSFSSHIKCKCETGNFSSCDVFQDVKKSFYHLSDILNQSFVPSITSNQMMYGVDRPISSHSSPFENFYIQFRQLQEKNRITELKHRCENEAAKLVKHSSQNIAGSQQLADLAGKEFSSPYQSPQPHLSHDFMEDPMVRARSIVLREQARTWKQQQKLINSSFAILPSEQGKQSDKFLNNIHLSNSHQIKPFQSSFLNFELDPETDYNRWMTRLNALQQKIRSHKML
ncbi:golgin subfamily B member 1-like [Uloborus diversus]|uniref:golgin subfamily B member 1-like n=1 Tax=Uloborus diversus TaxID=327109 RepID=UPI0024098A3E|nr:golgin subfamily B member 1-like [Uloborus diversus]